MACQSFEKFEWFPQKEPETKAPRCRKVNAYFFSKLTSMLLIISMVSLLNSSQTLAHLHLFTLASNQWTVGIASYHTACLAILRKNSHQLCSILLLQLLVPSKEATWIFANFDEWWISIFFHYCQACRLRACNPDVGFGSDVVFNDTIFTSPNGSKNKTVVCMELVKICQKCAHFGNSEDCCNI